jgi:hypothetical protein
MSIISNTSSSDAPEFAAEIGFDWGDKQHAVALFDGKTVESKKIAATPESLHGWLKEIGQRFEGKPVALALECTRGAVLNAFSAYPWLTIYPVNPLTSAQYRRAFVPSRAKDDVPDAQYLLEILRCHRHFGRKDRAMFQGPSRSLAVSRFAGSRARDGAATAGGFRNGQGPL